MKRLTLSLIEMFAGNDRISWRRPAAFGVATWLLVGGYIDSQQWIVIATAFIGGEALEAMTKKRPLDKP